MTVFFVWELVVTPLLMLAAFGYGMIFGNRRRRVPALPPTFHSCGDTWGQWQPLRVNIVDPTGRHLYSQAAQERKCDGCGYIEREKLSINK